MGIVYDDDDDYFDFGQMLKETEEDNRHDLIQKNNQEQPKKESKEYIAAIKESEEKIARLEADINRMEEEQKERQKEMALVSENVQKERKDRKKAIHSFKILLYLIIGLMVVLTFVCGIGTNYGVSFIFAICIFLVLGILKWLEDEEKADIEAMKKMEREKELVAERERNMAKIRAAGREEEFDKLFKEYHMAKDSYGLSVVTEFANENYRKSLSKEKRDPYIAGGIANGISGSGFLGAATVIQTELENQRIDQKLEQENEKYFDILAEKSKKQVRYERALKNLNRLLVECGIDPLQN